MRGDPLALVEDLYGASGEPDLDLGAHKAMRDAVVMLLHLDVVIEADAADPPLREHIRAHGQALERRPVDLFEEPAARHAEPPDRPLLVEPGEQLANRRVDLGEAVEDAMAEATEEPALDDEDGLLDVARLARPRRQDGSAVMRRHLRIGTIDLRVVQARLDDRDLGVVGHQQRRDAADRREGANTGADPVGEPLRPRRPRVGEARCTEHGDEDLRRSAITGQAVDQHRHAIAGIVDRQLVASHMGLAHRHRQTALPGAVELTEARVPVSAGLGGDIFLPQDRQRHVLAFELAVHGRPVGLGDAAVTLTVAIAGLGEQAKFQNPVGDVVWQRPAQARGLEPPERQPYRRGCRAHPSRNLAARQPGRLHPDHIAHTAHRKPLRRHPGFPFAKLKGLTLWEPEEASSPGRHHPGMVGDIISERVGDFKSEWWTRSSRNPGRAAEDSNSIDRNPQFHGCSIPKGGPEGQQCGSNCAPVRWRGAD
ncbi:hypothetical protein XH99_00795 [Bradyrhizobium nanningense]|uniref:Uncharacterized protein n=1 Tax=Bradyrhizobium nanningense TaxID=1325118 RepID=A0A4Q0SJB2_9BRAD|nr:hypothetical protein XH99_00795 [Bradyrhizobium nanningense]